MELSKKMVGWMDHLPLLVVVVVVEVLPNLHRHSLYREPWKIKNKIKFFCEIMKSLSNNLNIRGSRSKAQQYGRGHTLFYKKER